jgi:TRAP-type C4-dicarboxylate transport system permease small subunit
MGKYFQISKNVKPAGLFTALYLVPVTASARIKYTLDSYLPFDSLEELIVAILRIFITIATPIIVLFIIYAGFKYVTAQGNAQQVQEATRALTYAIIGAVLIIGAVAISEIIANTVGAFQAP